MLDIQEKEFEKVRVLFFHSQEIFFNVIFKYLDKSPAQPHLVLEYFLISLNL